jgi:hypothetical protein
MTSPGDTTKLDPTPNTHPSSIIVRNYDLQTVLQMTLPSRGGFREPSLGPVRFEVAPGAI